MTRFTTLQDELYANGVGLSSIPGIIVAEYPFFATGARRGDTETVPGRRGQLSAGRPLDAFAFSIPIGVAADNPDGSNPDTIQQARANMINNLKSVARAINTSGGEVGLQRRITTTTGTALHTARGSFVDGLGLNLLNVHTGQTELQFINLDGCWYDNAWSTAGPGTVTVGGEFSTRNIELVLPGPGTLTNSTAGVWVKVSVACTLKVEDFTSTAGIATLRHGGDNSWMVLYPGANALTWTGTGTPVIRFKAANV